MDPAYIEILDTNKELRKELVNEIATNDISNKKLKALSRELESCYNTISQQDSVIIAHEDEIAILKSEIISLKQRLQKALQNAEHKEKQLVLQEYQLQGFEENVAHLKRRIKELTDKKFLFQEATMALPDFLTNVATALDRVENYISGADTSINPINTLNGIRVTLT